MSGINFGVRNWKKRYLNNMAFIYHTLLLIYYNTQFNSEMKNYFIPIFTIQHEFLYKHKVKYYSIFNQSTNT